MYKSHINREFSSCNISFLVAGTLLILITTLFMNACSAKIGYDIMKPNIIVMNTVIASAAAGCQIFLSNQFTNSFGDKERVEKSQLQQQYNIHELCGGVLAGLISISGASANVALWAAALIGMIGSMYFQSLRKVFQRFEIDDPLDNSLIHGFCGIWSILAVGIFDMNQGLLYTGEIKFLGIQLLGVISYSCYSLMLSFIFFHSLKLNDRLRLDPLYEIIGMDFEKLISHNTTKIQDAELNRLIS